MDFIIQDETAPRRTAFFPSILPDELLSSVVARYALAQAMSPHRVNQELFGAANSVHFSYDLPTRIRALATHFPAETAAGLRDRHTLFPFFAAFVARERRDEIGAAMLDGEHVAKLLRGGKSLIPRPQHLRYCLACDEENLRSFGARYWQRRHQLPTNVVCVKHRLPLRASPALTRNEYRYVAADDWGPDRPALIPRLPSDRFERLVLLAGEGNRILAKSTAGRVCRDGPTMRDLSLVKGYRSSGGRAGQPKIRELSEAFVREDVDVVRLWPWLADTNSHRQIQWIGRMVTGGAGARDNSFTYAILKTFLKARVNDGTVSRHGDPAPVDWGEVAFEPRLFTLTAAVSAIGDDALVEQAMATVQAIRREAPPKRASSSEVFRRLPHLAHAIGSRRNPALRAAVLAIAETPRAFQVRRVRWLIAEAMEREDRKLTVAEVWRRGGLKNMTVARSILEQIDLEDGTGTSVSSR